MRNIRFASVVVLALSACSPAGPSVEAQVSAALAEPQIVVVREGTEYVAFPSVAVEEHRGTEIRLPRGTHIVIGNWPEPRSTDEIDEIIVNHLLSNSTNQMAISFIPTQDGRLVSVRSQGGGLEADRTLGVSAIVALRPCTEDGRSPFGAQCDAPMRRDK